MPQSQCGNLQWDDYPVASQHLHIFSYGSRLSGRLHARSWGLLALRSRGGRRPTRGGGEAWNTSPRRFSACNRSACIRNLKSEERGRPGGGHGGLGEFGAGDRALRGLGVLRISDGAPDPAKQTADRVSASPRQWVRELNAPTAPSGLSTPFGALGCQV